MQTSVPLILSLKSRKLSSFLFILFFLFCGNDFHDSICSFLIYSTIDSF